MSSRSPGTELFAPDNDTVASRQAGFYVTRAKILAEAIPALSNAAGSNRIDKFEDAGNTDMAATFKTNKEWPAERVEKDKGWLHSDVKDVAYVYLYRLYDNIVDKGGLDEN